MLELRRPHIIASLAVLSAPGVMAWAFDAAADVLGNAVGTSDKRPLSRPFLEAGYAYLPLVWAATLAHYLRPLLGDAGRILQVRHFAHSIISRRPYQPIFHDVSIPMCFLALRAATGSIVMIMSGKKAKMRVAMCCKRLIVSNFSIGAVKFLIWAWVQVTAATIGFESGSKALPALVADEAVISFLQGATLLVGLGGSLVLSGRLKPQAQPWQQCLPQAVLICGFTAEVWNLVVH